MKCPQELSVPMVVPLSVSSPSPPSPSNGVSESSGELPAQTPNSVTEPVPESPTRNLAASQKPVPKSPRQIPVAVSESKQPPQTQHQGIRP